MNVAFIPVRGGSKSIPLKNIKEIGGKPLVYWTAKAANDCKDIDQVYIATDNKIIKEVVESFKLSKVCVIGRSKENATDSASTESVMLEFAEKYEFDNIVLIQATSPLLTAEDLMGGFLEFNKKATDSVLSAVHQKRFCWNINNKGLAFPKNYDIFCRPRRQEFEGFWVENGAFYITSKQALLNSGNRLSGNIRIYEMDETTYLEIDEPSDWSIVEGLLNKRMGKYENIPKIKLFLTDCDGCLTDGGMYYSENGDELKKFNTLDGMGFRLLKNKGIITGIITGEERKLNQYRSKKMGIDILEQGVENKLEIVKKLCQQYGVSLQNVAYIGDDINDMDVIRKVGFGCSVSNGMKEVKSVAKYVSNKSGGEGAIREIIELILDNLE